MNPDVAPVISRGSDPVNLNPDPPLISFKPDPHLWFRGFHNFAAGAPLRHRYWKNGICQRIVYLEIDLNKNLNVALFVIRQAGFYKDNTVYAN